MEREHNEINIRVAAVEDAQQILQIYAPYIEKTAITFEYEVPALEEFRGRIQHTLKKYPYLVAEEAGEILGYAYTGPFKERAAYDWAVETTIYVKEDKKQRGIGKLLYQALEEISKAQNILNMNACIAYPENEDEHLTKNSVQFHEHLGYQMVGTFHQCGYKFETWYHMVWMEKFIGEHQVPPAEVIPFAELEDREDMNHKEELNVDEGLRGNEQIEEAIAALQQEPSQEMLAHTLTCIRRRMNENGQVIIAVEPPVGDQGMQVQAVQTDDGANWWVAFTGFEEEIKGSEGVMSTFLTDMGHLFTSALEVEEISGIILNPWNRTLMLNKKLINIILGNC